MPISQCRLRCSKIFFVACFFCLFPFSALAQGRTQTFLITGYYSPLPNQCCYVRGSYEADVLLNGAGIHGADSTPVYPGMIAAPDSYAFGTRIQLPGFGVGTVHDRGSRIVEWNDDVHRIDIWMGYGEEGLARALAWGARKVTGTVYPADGKLPQESFSFDSLPAPLSVLSALPKVDSWQMLAGLKKGDENFGVRTLQQLLAKAGYFQRTASGLFGDGTVAALARFQTDNGLKGDGKSVDDETRASLLAVQAMDPADLPPLAAGLKNGSSGDDVRLAQRLLRFLGYYRGRTDGIFDADVQSAVLHLQMDKKLVQTSSTPGAGHIGPATKTAILTAWRGKELQSRSQALLMKMQVADKIRQSFGKTDFVSKGNGGGDVSSLQKMLATLGYLDRDAVTGHFGNHTQQALLRYQLDRKIIASESSHGAGNFGPATKLALVNDAINIAWANVRAKGMLAEK